MPYDPIVASLRWHPGWITIVSSPARGRIFVNAATMGWDFTDDGTVRVNQATQAADPDRREGPSPVGLPEERGKLPMGSERSRVDRPR